MELNTEEDRFSDDEEELKKLQRPPSSYGSMKSDSDDMKEDGGASGVDEDNLGENQCNQEGAGVFNRPAPLLPREAAAYEGTGVQMNRPASPETLYTMTTMQTKPPGALVIDTGASDIARDSEDEGDEDDILITNSPEPPEPIEMEDEMQMDIDGQPGKLHPEQDLPHVFRSIQKALTELGKEDLYKFKLNFTLRLSSDLTLKQMFEGDLLDFVDMIIEMFGLELSLQSTIDTLKNITRHKEAEELRLACNKALIRFRLKQEIDREFGYIFEGIPQPGKRALVDDAFVEPEICRCNCGGVDPSHEIRSPLQALLQSPPPDTVVSLKNMFRMQRSDGQPVRTVVTTGIAGVGMSACVGKYCYDWAQERYNRDLQYVITLPFSSLWYLRNSNLLSSKQMSIMEVIEYQHGLCKTMQYLDDKECKFLILMDSFDCYQTLLDWKNTPVINESQTQTVKLDDLIVNLIRGTLLPHAQVWILGRRAAVTQIPSEFIDAFTENHGFSIEMCDEYMRKHLQKHGAELVARTVRRYKQLPALRALCRQPFICWMAEQIFGWYLRKYEGYGLDPPKLTPFCVNILVTQTNRRLEFYYDMPESNWKWSQEDVQMLIKLGGMALKMLARNITEFAEEDLKEHSLDLRDVTVFSGLCTELPPVSSGKRRFCFIHVTFLEFMAALYVFILFREDSKNVLTNSRAKTSVEIVQSAITLTFNSPLGRYDMFLRFLCGLIAPHNNKQLGGNLFKRHANLDAAIFSKEVKELVRNAIQTCPEDRRENLKECYREMTQVDN